MQLHFLAEKKAGNPENGATCMQLKIMSSNISSRIAHHEGFIKQQFYGRRNSIFYH
jgi:hypothetical protein